MQNYSIHKIETGHMSSLTADIDKEGILFERD